LVWPGGRSLGDMPGDYTGKLAGLIGRQGCHRRVEAGRTLWGECEKMGAEPARKDDCGQNFGRGGAGSVLLHMHMVCVSMEAGRDGGAEAASWWRKFARLQGQIPGLLETAVGDEIFLLEAADMRLGGRDEICGTRRRWTGTEGIPVHQKAGELVDGR